MIRKDVCALNRHKRLIWSLLIWLWVAYNRYLAHVIARLPESKLETPCRIGAEGAMTLRLVVTGYLSHLLHHLEQIGAAD